MVNALLQSAIEKSEAVSLCLDGSSIFGVHFNTKGTLLTKEEEQAIFQELKQLTGEERKLMVSRIARMNLGLVVNVIKQMGLINNQTCSMKVEDIFQYGVTGLIKAIDEFDLKRNCKFSTPASKYIRRIITRAIDNTGSMIRKPVYICDTRRTVLKKMEIPPAKQKKLEASLLLEKVLSLEAPLTESQSLLDIIADPTGGPEAQVESILRRENVFRVLNTLPDLLKTVIILYYGLDGEGKKSLEKVGKRLGFTKEWIKQLKNRALEELRKPENRQKLTDFI